MLSRDTGHSRVPAPPHIKTGISKGLLMTGLSHAQGKRASRIVRPRGAYSMPCGLITMSEDQRVARPLSHEIFSIKNDVMYIYDVVLSVTLNVLSLDRDSIRRV